MAVLFGIAGYGRGDDLKLIPRARRVEYSRLATTFVPAREAPEIEGRLSISTKFYVSDVAVSPHTHR
jgi:hypothetical protein